jgi:hypothetical protein
MTGIKCSFLQEKLNGTYSHILEGKGDKSSEKPVGQHGQGISIATCIRLEQLIHVEPWNRAWANSEKNDEEVDKQNRHIGGGFDMGVLQNVRNVIQRMPVIWISF